MRTIGRYEILDTLGNQGAGPVYLGNDPVLGRKVVIKTLAAAAEGRGQAELLESFLRNGQAASNIRHPGIVTTFDAFQSGDAAYLVTEYVPGRKLSDLLKERPDRDTAFRILYEMADALDYAHENGNVHGDIKPDNVLLDGSNKVRISDFGMAATKPASGGDYAPAEIIDFASPERIRRETEVDGKADQFSLAAIAYLMLTGRRPYEAKSQAAVAQKILGDPPTRASRVEKSLNSNVDDVLYRAMAASSRQRYASCAAFVKELDGAVGGSAPPIGNGTGYTIRPVFVAAAVLLAAGSLFMWWVTRAPAAPVPNFTLRLDGPGGPIPSGHEFGLGDPATPGNGGVSAWVTADGPVPPSSRVEVTLFEGDRTLDSAEIRPGADGARYSFKAPFNVARYSVRLTVGGARKSSVDFAIVPAAPRFGLDVRVNGELVSDGSREFERSRISAGGVTATITTTAERLDQSSTPLRIEWIRNADTLGASELTAADIGRAQPLPGGAAKPAAGKYLVKLTAGPLQRTVEFSILAQASNAADPGESPAKPVGRPAPAGLVSLAVTAHGCPIAPGESIRASDDKCGQLGARDLVAQITPIKPLPAGASVDLVWTLDGAETDHVGGVPVTSLGKVMPYRNIAEPGQYSVRVLVDGTLQREIRFTIEK